MKTEELIDYLVKYDAEKNLEMPYQLSGELIDEVIKKLKELNGRLKGDKT